MGGTIDRVGMELDAVPHGWVERIRTGIGGSDVALIDISGALREVRSIKSAWEVDRITEAATQIDAAMERAGASAIPRMIGRGASRIAEGFRASPEAQARIQALGTGGFGFMGVEHGEIAAAEEIAVNIVSGDYVTNGGMKVSDATPQRESDAGPGGDEGGRP